MKRAFAAVSLMIASLLSSPSAAQTPIPPMPTSNPAGWIGPNDFRDTAYASVRGAVISFRLDVSDHGLATACAILQSSGSPQVDSAACKALMSRARFKPGRDAEGKPTGGTYYSRIHLS